MAPAGKEYAFPRGCWLGFDEREQIGVELTRIQADKQGSIRRARLQPCRTEPQPVRALAPEVRVSMLRPEQNLLCNDRTSAAKAAHEREVDGTAEAVPFVQRLAVET